MSVSHFVIIDEYTTTVQADTIQNFIWINGTLSVELVQTQNMGRMVAKDMFKGIGQGAIIRAMVHKQMQGLAALVSRGQEQTVIFYSPQQNTSVVKSVGEITESTTSSQGISRNNQAMLCMEANTDGNVLFLGGGTGLEPSSSSDAIMYSVSFDRNLRKLDQLVLSDSTERKRAISCMRRDSTRNIIFAGVFQDVYVIEWTGSYLCVLRIFDNIHSCKFALTQTW